MCDYNILRKEDIIHSLQEIVTNDEDIEILKTIESKISIYDYKDSKYIDFHFLEDMTESDLSDKVWISPNIPDEYKIDKNKLVNNLFTLLDKNTFITLTGLYIIYDERDLSQLYKDTEDEWAYEVIDMDEYIGLTWFEKNICIVNMSLIEKTSDDMISQDYYSESKDEVILDGLWVTIIHELRHLLLDTNIILPEGEYPINLASEEEVEDYSRSLYDNIKLSNNMYLFIKK